MLTYLAILVRRRRTLFVGTVAVAGLAAIVSLLLPRWYVARTSILPPDSAGESLSMMAMLQGMNLPFLSGQGLLGAMGSTYESILESRSVREALIDDLDIVSYFGVRSREPALGRLAARTRTSILEDGILVLTYRDRDPAMAARIANHYVELLDRLNRELSTTRSGKTREFLERQIERRKETMSAAEESLRVFQETHGTVELTEQVRAAIGLGADLAATKSALEIELRLLGQFVEPSSPLYRWKRAQYEEADRQLGRLRWPGGDGDRLFPTMEEVPNLALQYARLLRSIKIEQAVYQLLMEQYERSRIEEVKDTPTLQVLDTARVPARAAYPRRRLIVFSATAAALLLLSFGLILGERYRARTLDADQLESLDLITREVRDDWRRILRALGRRGS